MNGIADAIASFLGLGPVSTAHGEPAAFTGKPHPGIDLSVAEGTDKHDPALMALASARVGLPVNRATIGSAVSYGFQGKVLWVSVSTVKAEKTPKAPRVSTPVSTPTTPKFSSVPSVAALQTTLYTLNDLNDAERRACRAAAKVTGKRADVIARQLGLLGVAR